MIKVITIETDGFEQLAPGSFPGCCFIINEAASSRSPTIASNCLVASETLGEVVRTSPVSEER